ncbi:MAG: hypothetical protein HQ526_04695 [Actinobacteria bacterium]|nr:hypothetical protein [Actinomycetota bacterium]
MSVIVSQGTAARVVSPSPHLVSTWHRIKYSGLYFFTKPASIIDVGEESVELAEAATADSRPVPCAAVGLSNDETPTLRHRVRQVTCTWIKAAGATFGMY